jgi:hypothetical protein
MPRGVYLLGVGLALVALALALTDWALCPRPGVTAENVQRIRLGMTVHQVELLLGRPADSGRIVGGPIVSRTGGRLWHMAGCPKEYKDWTHPSGGGISEGFGNDGRVTGYIAYGKWIDLPSALIPSPVCAPGSAGYRDGNRSAVSGTHAMGGLREVTGAGLKARPAGGAWRHWAIRTGAK